MSFFVFIFIIVLIFGGLGIAMAPDYCRALVKTFTDTIWSGTVLKSMAEARDGEEEKEKDN